MKTRNIWTPRVPASWVLLMLLLLLAAAVSAETWKASTLLGDLVLVETAAGPVLRGAAGEVALPLPATARVSSFGAAAEGWYVVAVENDSRLVGLAGRGSTPRPLAMPATSGALVTAPELLVGRDGLRAVAWLEGDAVDALAVRASSWQAGGWGPPETVSPPGPGSQMALTGAVLDDGSWLLAWAAFDGTDDEIVWSRNAGRGWSPPAPVAEGNRVPDITPRLLAVPGGALVAWSRYDGNDYRVNVARFAAGAWSEAQVVGSRGSVFPSWSDEKGTSLLLYRQAVPLAWGVLEIGSQGEVARRAELATPDKRRPVVTGLSTAGVALEWPGGADKTSSATALWEAR